MERAFALCAGRRLAASPLVEDRAAFFNATRERQRAASIVFSQRALRLGSLGSVLVSQSVLSIFSA